jgi:uncharacterized protein YjiS (DUF1127 family)
MFGSIQHALRQLGASISEWRERERALNELSALDDRTLADIGLRRTDIPFIVKGTAEHAQEAGRAAPAEARPAANSNATPPRRVA